MAGVKFTPLMHSLSDVELNKPLSHDMMKEIEAFRMMPSSEQRKWIDKVYQRKAETQDVITKLRKIL